jgi:uncharacterized protein (TIGR03067 family)
MIVRLPYFLAALLLCGAAASPARAQDGKKALAELHGTWKITALEANGQPAETVPNMPHWVIKDAEVRYGGTKLADLSVDGNASPRSMDLTFADPKRVFEAIYTIEGNTLKICVNTITDGVKERPGDFTTEDKAGRRLLTLTRLKAGAGDGTADAAGFIGIQIRVDKDTKAVEIGGVLKGTPAEKAGLKQDDVLVKVGTEDAGSLKGVVDAIRELRPGADVTIRVRRGDKEQDVKVRVGVMPFFLFG